MQTNNFFSRIYVLLRRIYTFSFELFVLIFKFLGYFVKNDFFGVKIDKILSILMKIFGNKISNYNYNSEQLIRVWIISCHIVSIRFFIIFIINFS